MTKKLVRGPDRIPPPERQVSFSELTVGDKKIELVLEKCGVDFVLEKLWGFDTKHKSGTPEGFYEVKECQHRNRDGKIVTGKLYIGVERLDDEWILQGAPSEKAKLAAKQDLSLYRELSSMSRSIQSC
ncbi:hypothetical protein Aci011_081 [Acinetobacter phage vB_AbaM_B09_Aci01-1]|uniref:Uncharacterized protein n=2 Tax=Saclayvirus TaxID=2733128 RepID=A0A386KLE7_9CAUD|nr:thymidylate synthase [Acinetobacter phage vB_AbaM_B09_Aci01-1]YP_009813304.1 thymidylate synthase [Acinetobacter phage vB_AbaM_B09_Aci02-2]AZF88481.1 hypothetical protein TAC_0093 [Acinetobacter phage TAC1]QMP19082.1 hypothetical protein FKOIJHOC_00134 [Acinetobacter phage Ab_121]QQV88780.1 hypothetical protein Liucustia_80 [Acinetobacter phage Liucustia]UYL86267.1 baseplate wedge subunit [Acinetobacter phage vB_AbaM_CP14]AYD85609.1 hypothetical protein Aci011_081 [Acinetobacter phage vB_A